jgi:hypothetical protein
MVDIRPAPKGTRTVYVRHGIWYDVGQKRIHVTVPGTNTKGAAWSVGRNDKQFPLYRALLEEAGRWPADAD